jgi:hypothetical protein
MKQTWSNPPVTTYGPSLAAEIVTLVREEADILLDYSPSSLALVDRIIDGIARENLSPRAVTRLLLRLGAYTGEVLVRRAGGSWVEFDLTQRGIFDQPFGIRTPDGQVWNPLGKVAERYEAGMHNSLSRFYRSVAGQVRV